MDRAGLGQPERKLLDPGRFLHPNFLAKIRQLKSKIYTRAGRASPDGFLLAEREITGPGRA
jgi:hypothetical protein